MRLPCHGATADGIAGDSVADRLAERGVVELVEDVERLVAAARDGCEVIALDACATGCQARLLDASGVPSLRAVNLSDPRLGVDEVASAGSASELGAAASAVTHKRPSPPTGESGASPLSSHTLEDYLLAVDALTSPVGTCGVLVDAPTLAAHVAHLLGVTRVSAGAMLVRLEDAGLVHRSAHKDVLLTVEGRAVADAELAKQRVLECFVSQTLGYELHECHDRARQIAAGFDEQAVDRVRQAIGDPERCPHGWPIDADEARRDASGLVALSTVHAGCAAQVERLEETHRERLRVLCDSGIAPGSRLRDVVVNEAAELVTFAIGESTGVVSTRLAASALVRVEGGEQ